MRAEYWVGKKVERLVDVMVEMMDGMMVVELAEKKAEMLVVEMVEM